VGCCGVVTAENEYNQPYRVNKAWPSGSGFVYFQNIYLLFRLVNNNKVFKGETSMDNNKKENCWEFNKCTPADKEACTVPGLQESDGKNHGTNAGRCCWQEMKQLGAIPGLEFIREKFLEKCLTCEFFLKVQEEEGRNFNFFY